MPPTTLLLDTLLIKPMFGGFTGFTRPLNTDMGEQVLNAVANQSIRHLFTSSEAIDVQIRCFPSSKLLQGSIDSFKMQGRNLVIRRDFRVEEMSFTTDAVSIDPASALGGKLRLKQPTQAVAQVILTEDGINKAFDADLVRQHLVNVEMEALTNLSGGEPVSFRDIHITLMPENQVHVGAKVDLPNRKDLPISLRSTIAVEKRRQIRFQNAEFDPAGVPEEGRSLSKIVSLAFAEVLDGMVDLDRFDLDGVMVRINRLETHGKKLVFTGYAQIDHFPGSG
ncbi:hypothetical protein O77CONTIG1_04574 [Leptolyngbya sp. O-77]|nr:hypothetical protein O77CONTIG1_04574 [Leptolyngbya sp. O-77]